MTPRSTPLLLVAVVATLIACSTAAGPSAPAQTLDGHTYLSTEIRGATLVPDTRVRLTFLGGSLNASAGCNLMGGSYALDGDRLTTNQLSMTEMACDDARQRQDEWLANFLGKISVALDGDTLTLTDGTVTLTLLDKEVATPDAALEGTHWVLDGIVSGGAVSSVPVGVTATIMIRDGHIELKPGCNSGGGTVDVSPHTMTFGPIALTKMACEPAAMSVESSVLAVLDGAVTYAIDADRLVVTSGGRGLTFRATN